MISKDDILNSEFLKQFKDSKDFSSFMEELYVRGTEKMLEGELDHHLGYGKHSPEGRNSGNSRNGKTSKKLKSKYGEVEIEVPRDRAGTFEPVLVPKRRGLAEGIEELVISLYAKGMSTRDIEEQLREIYGFNLSESTVSTITHRVSEDIAEWQQRPLERLYCIVWMDGIAFKVRHSGKVISKTVYLAVGLNSEGRKELLGMWLSESESAAFWVGVLTDIRARGVEDILITCTDNLSGFTQGIRSVFPEAATQVCVVHQIRNSCRYVVWRDKKAFAADMKAIYNAPTREVAAVELERFEQAWGSKYPYAVKSWRANWEELTVFFDFPLEIRRIIYTTNLIENLNGKIRKYTKGKGAFPDDGSVRKAVFLALREITKKWTQPQRNWGLIMNQFVTLYPERCRF
ncbi:MULTISPECIES: IS256 family transposase [Pontibacter]|uniref:Mutator family transposase n=2 Tax=Pontibacter TaxID=323449 RepID=A0A1I2ZXL6_9BACT|nr:MULTISPECIES: IS256 family transposase [Pontibacter]ARS38108.1 IS256 family transposase [Pontibacter actiniarum]SFH42420.1 Transposase (or an inactivated derivative) [Pontibacter chinhatensis]